MVAASSIGSRLFRNNVGVLKDERGQHVRFGLGVGTSDLIGWTPVLITESMVGKTLAVFSAVEVKTMIGRLTEEQQDFIFAVNKAGGIAFVARSADEAVSQLTQ